MMVEKTWHARRRALVVGSGSIGTRHSRLLREVGCRVGVVSRRPGGDYSSIEEGVQQLDPEYVVVATETGAHRNAVESLLLSRYRGPLLVEKPLGAMPSEIGDFVDASSTWVGYNLRFHPVVARTRSLLADEQVLSIQVRAGQYLPDWRPGRDYRSTASNAAEGGVLRDLSHELDLLEWLVGPCRSIAAVSGQFSSLELEVDDVTVAIMQFERAPIVTMELNYFDRMPSRSMTFATNESTIVADLIANTVVVDGEVDAKYSVGRDATYAMMHRAVLSSETNDVCTWAEGQRVMRLLESIEVASSQRAWVDV